MKWRTLLALCCFVAYGANSWGTPPQIGPSRLPSPDLPAEWIYEGYQTPIGARDRLDGAPAASQVNMPGESLGGAEQSPPYRDVDFSSPAAVLATDADGPPAGAIENDSGIKADSSVVPCSLLQSRHQWADPSLMPTPIAVFPGRQYVDHRLDQWFTNVYAIGSGWLGIDAVARAYYITDQRIQWSGVEATFAAEGAITARYQRCYGDVSVAVGSDFFLTQPFNRNIFVDTEERQSYVANYDYQSFEISQLYVELQKGRFAVRAGKMITPFGRYYYPVETNLQLDAPFIRTECIRRRETGVLFRYLGERITGDVGLVNGCDDRDTNSSKALIARIGYEAAPFTAGISVKSQDGIGSEEQKQFNSHVGGDVAWQMGRWTISSEVLHDEYGLRHDFDPDSIFWGRSIYYRDVNAGEDVEITGLGWYIDCLYRGERWLLEFNYGQFHPDRIGIPQHDEVNRRGIIKVAYDVTKNLQVYNVCIIENEFECAQCDRVRRPWCELVGLQYRF